MKDPVAWERDVSATKDLREMEPSVEISTNVKATLPYVGWTPHV